jgi:hypothetical protein
MHWVEHDAFAMQPQATVVLSMSLTLPTGSCVLQQVWQAALVARDPHAMPVDELPVAFVVEVVLEPPAPDEELSPHATRRENEAARRQQRVGFMRFSSARLRMRAGSLGAGV